MEEELELKGEENMSHALRNKSEKNSVIGKMEDGTWKEGGGKDHTIELTNEDRSGSIIEPEELDEEVCLLVTKKGGDSSDDMDGVELKRLTESRRSNSSSPSIGQCCP